MTVPVPATREEAAMARYPSFKYPEAEHTRQALIRGFMAGSEWGLRRAAEIARGSEEVPGGADSTGRVFTCVQPRFPVEGHQVSAAILAECSEGSK